jgi:regulatory protein
MAGKITAIEVQARNPRRVNVYLDGVYAFPLSVETTTRAGLRRDMELSDQRVAELIADDTMQKNYDAALNFLSFRPRSESEMRRYLSRRQVDPSVSEQIIARLRESKLLDDEAFARFWVENREAFSPRSGRALRSELRSKGVAAETIEATIDGDDSAAAYQAAAKKARLLSAADRDAFRRKLYSFLQRRGFSYDTTRETVERVWREKLEQQQALDIGN